MTKGYIVTTYRAVLDHARFQTYARLAGPALESIGGRFLVRGTATRAPEAGMLERTVVVEFPSLAEASAAYDSPGYRTALDALGDGAVRDVRLVEGV